MAKIISGTSRGFSRNDADGVLRDYSGVVFSYEAGKPALWLTMDDPNGRQWRVMLNVAETERLIADVERIRKRDALKA